MTLPVLEKTWLFNVNQSTATSGVILTDAQSVLLKIKQALVGFGTAPWTVVSSSDGITSGYSDYWTSASSLIWSSSIEHSWIVLQQTGVNGSGGHTQICIDLSTDYPYWFSIAFSPAAEFAGGSTTARPTAYDEYALINQTWFPSSAMNTVLHAMQSSTGACTRVFVLSGGLTYCSLIVDTLYADSPLSYKGVFSYISNPTYSPGYSSIYCSTPIFKGIFGSIKYDAFLGIEGYYPYGTLAAENAGAISDFTGQYPLSPISLHSETASAAGRVGRLSDIFIGSISARTGCSYPQSETITNTNASLAFSTPTITLTSAGASFTTKLIGQAIVISNAANSNNNGTFTITGVPSSTTLTYINASGATQAPPTNVHYSATNNYQFIQLGGYVLPWNGTQPVIG